MYRYQGLLYRAINPVHAREPLSGEGARRHGGRFNPRGLPALYTSRSVMTAVREANQIGTLQPTTGAPGCVPRARRPLSGWRVH